MILPELVSGRGTARRSRVVEGQPCDGERKDRVGDVIRRGQNARRRDAESADSRLRQPGVAAFVPLAPHRMGRPIDLDRQSRIGAIGIEYIRPAWMLTAELASARRAAQSLPQQHLRQGHLPSQSPCAADTAMARVRRNVLEHRVHPSTMLRMVPLPETSSGRIRSHP